MDKRGTLSRVTEEKPRDPFNTAVATELNAAFERKDFGWERLVRATGISRATLRRYLEGKRDIRVAELRKISTALGEPIADIMTKAQGSLENDGDRDS